MARTLKMTLLQDLEYGPRLVEIGNWSGKALFSPYHLADSILKREEMARPGIYILKGVPLARHFEERVYIGEAEVLKKRLSDHIRKPPLEIREVLAFTTSDENLHKGSIKYLEYKLITEAQALKYAEVSNGVTPNQPKLPEGDKHDMDDYFSKIRLILPTLGFRFLTATESHALAPALGPVFRLKSPAYKATMDESEGKFRVHKGSQCNKAESKTLSDGWRRIRKRLLEQKILVDSGPCFVFAKDALFESLSAASSVVLGRQTPGPDMWVDEQGISFKQYQEKRLLS